MSNDTPKRAKAGEQIAAKAAARMRRDFPHLRDALTTRESTTIQPKSETKHGQWGCVDCGEMLPNNMAAHGHAKSHRLAWWVGLHFEEA